MRLSELDSIEVAGGRLYHSPGGNLFLAMEREGKINFLQRFRPENKLCSFVNHCRVFVSYEEDCKQLEGLTPEQIEVSEKKEIFRDFYGDIKLAVNMMIISDSDKKNHRDATITVFYPQEAMFENITKGKEL